MKVNEGRDRQTVAKDDRRERRAVGINQFPTIV